MLLVASAGLVLPAGVAGQGPATREANAREAPENHAPERQAAERSSHRRMVAELAEIAEGASLWNPFFRSRQLERLRFEVRQLPEATTPAERLRRRFELGMQEFRLGSLDNAIRELTLVHREMAPAEIAARSQVAFYLGLAYLRLGERQNCVAGHTGESCILPIRGGGVHTAKENARRAIGHFREVLSIAPEKTVEHVAVRWLLTIARMAVGDYPDRVPEAERLDPAIFAPEAAFPRWPNIAPQVGLDVVDHAGGAVVEDLDGDGRLDILTSSWAPASPLKLFRNRGDGGFEEIGDAAGLAGLTGGLNLVHADYDDDGDADVLVLRGAWLGPNGRHPNSLLRNDGGGRFTDVTFAAGVGDDPRPTQTGAWADYDNDGDLDLYVGNEGNEELFPAQLFRNEGDGTFTDVAAAAGVENRRYAKAVAWGDFDGDRFPDLYVSNYLEANRLYRNNRDGTFTDVAPELGVTGPLSAFATWFWDYDNDGVLDLYVASFPYAANAGLYNLFSVVAGYLGIEVSAEPGRLYRGDGRGGFEEVGVESGLGRITMPMGANFGDLDNDGFLDFYLGTSRLRRVDSQSAVSKRRWRALRRGDDGGRRRSPPEGARGRVRRSRWRRRSRSLRAGRRVLCRRRFRQRVVRESRLRSPLAEGPPGGGDIESLRHRGALAGRDRRGRHPPVDLPDARRPGKLRLGSSDRAHRPGSCRASGAIGGLLADDGLAPGLPPGRLRPGDRDRRRSDRLSRPRSSSPLRRPKCLVGGRHRVGPRRPPVPPSRRGSPQLPAGGSENRLSSPMR